MKLQYLENYGICNNFLFHQGVIRINPKNYREAFITSPVSYIICKLLYFIYSFSSILKT